MNTTMLVLLLLILLSVLLQPLVQIYKNFILIWAAFLILYVLQQSFVLISLYKQLVSENIDNLPEVIQLVWQGWIQTELNVVVSW